MKKAPFNVGDKVTPTQEACKAFPTLSKAEVTITSIIETKENRSGFHITISPELLPINQFFPSIWDINWFEKVKAIDELQIAEEKWRTFFNES